MCGQDVGPRADGCAQTAGAAGMVPDGHATRILRREGRTRLLLAALSLAGIVVAEVVAVVVAILAGVGSSSLEATLVPEVFGALSAVLAVVLLGGRGWAGSSRADLSLAFRSCWWILAVAAGLMALDLIDLFGGSKAVVADWPRQVALSAVLCLAIGVFEEFMFRGIILNGLLAVMGGTYRGVLRAMLICSLLFGAAHVNFTEDLTDVLSVTQALLKMVQTGIYSFVLCTVVLGTRKLGGVSLVHGLDDFLLVMPSVALRGEALSTDYVLEGDQGVQVIFLYLLVIALYLPVLLRCLRMLRRGRPAYRGAFMEEVERRLAAEAQRREAPVPAGEPQAGALPPVGLSAGPHAAAPVVPGPVSPVPSAWRYVPEQPAQDLPATAIPCQAAPVAPPPQRRRDGRGSGRPPVPRGLE